MKVFKNLNSSTYKYTTNSILIIGNLDGVHKGHQSIIKSAKRIANEQKSKIGVLLFDPHPRKFFNKHSPNFLLTQINERIKILGTYGIDYVMIIKFNKKISSMSPNVFCNQILLSGINMKNILVGKNFKFGKQRSGDYKYLLNFGKQNNFQVTPIKLLKTSPSLFKKTKMKIYSSTNIRELIKNGKMKLANDFLGNNYSVTSKVIKGDQRGRQIGVPTANLKLEEHVAPKYGVYAVKASLTKNSKKRIIKGIANFGIRPTFGKKDEILEVHLFRFKLNIYNSLLKVEFVDFIREEKRFSGIETLKKQLKSDISKAQKILSK